MRYWGEHKKRYGFHHLMGIFSHDHVGGRITPQLNFPLQIFTACVNKLRRVWCCRETSSLVKVPASNNISLLSFASFTKSLVLHRYLQLGRSLASYPPKWVSCEKEGQNANSVWSTEPNVAATTKGETDLRWQSFRGVCSSSSPVQVAVGRSDQHGFRAFPKRLVQGCLFGVAVTGNKRKAANFEFYLRHTPKWLIPTTSRTGPPSCLCFRNFGVQVATDLDNTSASKGYLQCNAPL